MIELADETEWSVAERRTLMFATQREVRLLIRDPDTPGGFKLSIAVRAVSRSLTGCSEAMVQKMALARSPNIRFVCKSAQA